MQSNLLKKLVSLTLAVCLFLGSCPVSALAEALNTKVSASPMADDIEKQNPQTPVDSYVASAPRMNAVSISDDISNGTVTASHESANVGETVTLTITPENGYAVDTLTVKDTNGNDVPTTKVEKKQVYLRHACGGRGGFRDLCKAHLHRQDVHKHPAADRGRGHDLFRLGLGQS